MSDDVLALVFSDPFRVTDRTELRLPVGITVAEAIDRLALAPAPGRRLRVLYGDRVVAEADRGEVRLDDASRAIIFRPVPEAPVIPVLMAIGSAIASAATATATTLGLGGLVSLGVTGGSLLGASLGFGATFFAWAGAVVTGLAINAGVGMLANLAVNALVRPPSGGNLGGGAGSPATSPSITGAANDARRFGPVPRVFGRHWMIFPLAANTFTEVVGGDVYLRMLLTAGYGPLDIDEWRIGDTQLADFDDIQLQFYDGVETWEYDVANGMTRTSLGAGQRLTLFRDDVESENPGAVFDTPSQENSAVEPSEWAVRSTAPGTREVAIDFQFPLGLNRVDSGTGNREKLRVLFDLEYKPFGADDSAYVPVEPDEFGQFAAQGTQIIVLPPLPGTLFPQLVEVPLPGRIRFEAKTIESFSTYVKHNHPTEGQWTYRMRRFETSAAGAGPRFARVVWAGFRSIRELNFATMPNVTLIALRVRATDQLNGVVQLFRGRVTSKLRAFLGVGAPGADADGLGPYLPSRNPAWAFLHVLIGPEAQRPLSLDRIDLARLQTWAAICEPVAGTYAHAFDMIFDYGGTQLDALSRIASAARASYTQRDSLQSVIIDYARPSTGVLVTPRNAFDTKGRRLWIERPHALRYNFQNEDAENQTDEGIFYAPGYTEDNATVFETLECLGTTRSSEAWQRARYHWLNGRYRDRFYEATLDVDALELEPGDRFDFAHAIHSVAKAGRIIANGVDLTGRVWLDLDEECEFEPGKSYSVQIRWLDAAGDPRRDVVAVVRDPIAPAGETYATHRLVFDVPVPDDADHAWKVGDLVAFRENDVGTLDAIVHHITPQPGLRAALTITPYAPEIFANEDAPPHEALTAPLIASPPVPEILTVASVGETLVIGFKVAVPLDPKAAAAQVQVQYRIAGDPPGSWIDAPSVLPSAGTIALAIDVANLYDVRLRSVGSFSRFSAWARRDALSHTGTEYSAADFDVVALQVKNRGGAATWIGPDLEVTWRLRVRGAELANPPSAFAGYRVAFYNADGTARREVEVVTDPRYTYSREKNREDSLRQAVVSSFPADVVAIGVRPLDVAGGVGPETRRTFSNPAAAVPTAQATRTSLGINFEWAEPPDSDFLRFLIERSEGPSGPWTRVFAGTDKPAFVDTRGLPSTVAHYYRYAADDGFSEDPARLLWSTPVALLPGDLIEDEDLAVGAVVKPDFFNDPPVPSLVGLWTSPPFGLPDYYSFFSGKTIQCPKGCQLEIHISLVLALLEGNPPGDDTNFRYTLRLGVENTGGGGAATVVELNRIILRKTQSNNPPDQPYVVTTVWPAEPAATDLSLDFSMVLAKEGSPTEYVEVAYQFVRWLRYRMEAA